MPALSNDQGRDPVPWLWLQDRSFEQVGVAATRPQCAWKTWRVRIEQTYLQQWWGAGSKKMLVFRVLGQRLSCHVQHLFMLCSDLITCSGLQADDFPIAQSGKHLLTEVSCRYSRVSIFFFARRVYRDSRIFSPQRGTQKDFLCSSVVSSRCIYISMAYPASQSVGIKRTGCGKIL